MENSEGVERQWYDPLMAATVLKLIPRRVTPNHITALRFFSIPFVIWLLVGQDYRWGLPAFALSAFTDMIDGSMARTRSQITEWGKFYDPVADKLLVGSAVVLIVANNLGWLLAGTILGLECIIVAVALWRKSKGIVVQANQWGKVKMVFQVAGVCLLMAALVFNIAIFATISVVVFWLAVLLGVIALLSYGL